MVKLPVPSLLRYMQELERDEFASLRQYLPARDERLSESQPTNMETKKADRQVRLMVDASIAREQD